MSHYYTGKNKLTPQEASALIRIYGSADPMRGTNASKIRRAQALKERRHANKESCQYPHREPAAEA